MLPEGGEKVNEQEKEELARLQAEQGLQYERYLEKHWAELRADSKWRKVQERIIKLSKRKLGERDKKRLSELEGEQVKLYRERERLNEQVLGAYTAWSNMQTRILELQKE